MLRIEKELEEARKRLAVIHKAKYQEPSSGGGPEEAEINSRRFLDRNLPGQILHNHSFESVKVKSLIYRLDNLLESSAERMNSATNAFSIMKLQQSPQNGQSPQLLSPIKPPVSPKPGSAAWEKKFASPTSASPFSMSGVSESSVPPGGNGAFLHHHQSNPSKHTHHPLQ